MASLLEAIPTAIPGANVDGIEEDDVAGQVFSGGEADITYCELFTDLGDFEEIRIDAAPGPLDLTAYLDEEFGLEPDDLGDSARIDGEEAVAGCFDDACLAVLAEGDLAVAVRLIGSDVTAEQALDALEGMRPLVIANLAIDAVDIT